MQKGDQQTSNKSQSQKNSSSNKDTSFRRKQNEQSSSEQKISKFNRLNRPSQRSFDQVSVSSANKSNFGATQEENQKLMVLSNEARDALKSMQRFDRFIYVTESEKKLKVPIEAELKRLEKIKNSGNKLMKNTFFDNELTITCLFNHMKNLYQIARDLGEIVTLKAEIEVLQQKIIEMNVKFNKDLKEASMGTKGKAAEDQQILKDTLKYIDTMIYALKEKNVDKGRKKIEADLKRATDNRKQLLELVHNLLGRVGGGAVIETLENQQQNGADIYQFNLTKLIQDQGTSQKNLLFLQSQKASLEKSIKQNKAQQIKNIYNDLKQTSTYLIQLNTTIKETENNLLISQKKAVTSFVSEEDKLKLKQFQELESIINGFEQEGDVWHKEMEVINIKVENEEGINGELVKNRKLLNSKKQLNATVSKLVNPYFNLLEQYNKRSSDTSSNTNSLKQISDKYNQLLVTNQNLQSQLKKLKKQLQSSTSNAKQQIQINKFLTLLQQSLTLKQGTDTIPISQYQKIKKYIDLNRRKIPEDFLPTFTSFQTLIKTIIQTEQLIKQRQLQDQKGEQIRNREINTIETTIKTLQKLLFSNDPVNDGFINKLKRGIEQNTVKIDKLGESQVNSLIKMENSYIVRLMEILGDVFKGSKGKGGEEVEGSKELEELRNQVKQKDLEATRTSKTIAQLEAKINKLNGEFDKLNTKDNSVKQEITEFKKTITSLQKDKNNLEKNIATLQKDKLNITKRLQQSILKSNQYQSSLQTLKQSSKVSATEDTKKNNQINTYKTKIDKYQKQKVELNKEIELQSQEIEELNRKLAETTEELSVQTIQFTGKQSELAKLVKQIEGLTNNNLHLTDKNKQLLNEKKLIGKELEDLKRENRDLVKGREKQTGERNELSGVMEENERLMREIDELNDRYNSIIGEYENVQNELKAKIVRLGQIEGELKRNSAEYEKQKLGWNQDLTKLRTENTKLQTQQTTIKNNNTLLQQKYNTQSQRYQQLHRQFTNKKSDQTETSNLKSKIYQLQTKLNKSHLQNTDLNAKINNYLTQVSQLKSQNRLLESQVREKGKVSSTTTNVAVSSGEYEIQRYQALKEENIMLKERIVARDLRIEELEKEGEGHGGVSNLSQVSVGRDQETIRRLERELQQVRLTSSHHYTRNNTATTTDTRLLNENNQLKQTIKIKQINLQNALGDNDYLYRQVNRYKQTQSQLQSKVTQLTRQLSLKTTTYSPHSVVTTTNAHEITQLKRDNTSLVEQRGRLDIRIKTLENQCYDHKLAINSKVSEIDILKQKVRALEQNERSQKKIIDDLMYTIGTKNNTNTTNSVMQKKFIELQSSIKAITSARNNDETISLRHQNTELRNRVRTLQNQSHTRHYDDPARTDDRINELLTEKLHFVKTIKSIQTLLHSKDIKLIEIYDQREIDLRGFINENKRLQTEINRINERLVQEKVKHLIISPQFLEESMNRMESQLVELKKENVILKEEIYVLAQELEEREKDKGVSQDGRSHSNLGVTDKAWYDKARILEIQKSKLIERVNLLNVFHQIENQSQALVSNVNRLVDGIMIFLSESDDFSDCDLNNTQFLSAINESLNNQDYEQYFQIVEDLFKDLFLRVVGRKNEILEKQAQQLLLLREKMEELLEQEEGYDDDSYSKSNYGRSRGRYVGGAVNQDNTKKKASLIALQHLFKLYLKAKDPAVLREISELLTMSQNRSRYYE